MNIYLCVSVKRNLEQSYDTSALKDATPAVLRNHELSKISNRISDVCHTESIF